jgi:hypothetical protein
VWRDLEEDLASEFTSFCGAREPYWRSVGLTLRRLGKGPESERAKRRKDAWWKANHKWVNTMRRVARARKEARAVYAKAREQNPNMTKAERWAAWWAANRAWRCEAQRAERLKKALKRPPRSKMPDEILAEKKAAYWAANRDRLNAKRREDRILRRDEINAKRREADKANRERINAQKREARRRNPGPPRNREKEAARYAAYWLANKERFNAKRMAEYARKALAKQPIHEVSEAAE